jgi:hypothetical protein
MVGDFDHKSCFEILTDASIAERLFSPEDRRLFARHVLWTRVVGPRNTTLPRGGEGDLLEYARKNREQLVLKPNRGYGGKGVMLGAATESAEWDQLLNEAAAASSDPEHSWWCSRSRGSRCTNSPWSVPMAAFSASLFIP